MSEINIIVKRQKKLKDATTSKQTGMLVWEEKEERREVRRVGSV